MWALQIKSRHTKKYHIIELNRDLEPLLKEADRLCTIGIETRIKEVLV